VTRRWRVRAHRQPPRPVTDRPTPKSGGCEPIWFLGRLGGAGGRCADQRRARGQRPPSRGPQRSRRARSSGVCHWCAGPSTNRRQRRGAAADAPGGLA
jgi:hypothetical protein